jgi:hypothetical protein
MPDKIPFSYEELVNAIANAIEMAEQKDGATVVDSMKIPVQAEANFDEVRAKAQMLWKQLVGEGDNARPDIANAILKKIEITMGRRMKLSEFTEDQVELLNLVVLDMEDMVR